MLLKSDVAICRITDAQAELQVWRLPAVDWPVADRLVQVVKTVRMHPPKRVQVQKRDGNVFQTGQAVPAVTTNFYATNVDLGSVPPLFIHQLGRSRWSIDAQACQPITTDCHLKQPSIHQSCALVMLTMIRVLAHTLTTVSCRLQVRSHYPAAPRSFCEMAWQIGYRSLAVRLDFS